MLDDESNSTNINSDALLILPQLIEQPHIQVLADLINILSFKQFSSLHKQRCPIVMQIQAIQMLEYLVHCQHIRLEIVNLFLYLNDVQLWVSSQERHEALHQNVTYFFNFCLIQFEELVLEFDSLIPIDILVGSTFLLD